MPASAAFAIARTGATEPRAAGHKGSGLVKADLVSASQKQILDSGALEVRIDAKVALKLRLRGLSRLGSGQASKVAKPRRARLDAGESQTSSCR